MGEASAGGRRLPRELGISETEGLLVQMVRWDAEAPKDRCRCIHVGLWPAHVHLQCRTYGESLSQYMGRNRRNSETDGAYQLS